MESATAIATNIVELGGSKPIIISDADASDQDRTDHNLILIGSPDSNHVLIEAYEMGYGTRVTAEYPGENKGILEISANPWNENKSLLIIAGSDEWGVKASVAVLSGSQELDGHRLSVEWGQSGGKLSSYLSKIDATLDLLLTLRGQEQIPEDINDIVMKDTVSVSINFARELDNSEIQAVEKLGATFKRLNGDVAHSGTIYGADVPWDKIDDLSEIESVVRIESTWQPGMENPDN